jgi:hypothetical protein
MLRIMLIAILLMVISITGELLDLGLQDHSWEELFFCYGSFFVILFGGLR